MTDDYQARFGGIARLYGQHGLERLRAARIAIVGLGGVGSWAAEALARSGIGHLILIDMDDICISNTNRQIHALDGQYGQPKTRALALRLRSINPGLHIEERFDFLTPANTVEHLDTGLSGVIDAIDSVKPKTHMIDHCKRHGIRLVTTGAAGGQSDPTRLRIDDLSRTVQDPLLASVRRRLRSEYRFPAAGRGNFGIEAVYSTEPVRRPDVCDGAGLDCNGGLGASVCVTAPFGFAAAARLIHHVIRAAVPSEGSP